MHSTLQRLNPSLLAQLTANMIVVTDAEGAACWANAGFTALTGYSVEELIGKKPGKLLQGPETDPEALFRIKKALASQLPFREKLLNYSKSGRRYWVDIECQPIRSNDGELVGYIAVETDITATIELEISLRANVAELTASQKSLENERARLAIAIDAANIGLWDWNLLTNEVFFSKTWYSMLDYGDKELPERLATWESLCHPDDLSGAYKDINAHLRGESEIYCNKHRLRIKDGSFHWIKDVGRVVNRDSDGNPVRMVGVHIDIQSEHLHAEALSKAKDLAEAGNGAKSQFLANMSHEIRTPMNGVLGMTELLIDTNLDSEQKELAEAIRGSATSLLAIINDILDFSKIDAQKLTLSNAEFSLRSAISALQQIHTHKAETSGVDLLFDIADDIPDYLIGDVTRLKQVLVNLIGNAIKFTLAGGSVLVNFSILESSAGCLNLAVNVIDSGAGVPENKQEAIFNAFTQADGSATRSFGGTGLGLTISRQLVALMGGELSMKSKEGEGSRFTFNVKLKTADEAHSAKKEIFAKEVQTVEPDRTASILVAEDNVVNQMLIRKILEKAGHQVTIAGNGVEAVELATTGKFDIIFMDIQMPEMGGQRAAVVIRERSTERVPIVALTAHALVGDREKYLESGMDEYISKPIDRAQLLEMVQRLTMQKKPSGSEVC